MIAIDDAIILDVAGSNCFWLFISACQAVAIFVFADTAKLVNFQKKWSFLNNFTKYLSHFYV